MNTFARKALLLTAVFALVTMLICILHTKCAYAASTSSMKTKAGKVTYAKSTRNRKVVSRGSVKSMVNVSGISIVSLAKRYLGARYVYGASGPNSFDCSGFTMYVYGSFGISLPHSASGQSAYGMTISKQDLKPGDLVYFATGGGRKISHVGIYTGDGCFIHASLHGVVMSSLNENYYYTRYVSTKRILKR